MVEREGIYWIDEPVYRFHHVLIRDAAYHLSLKDARAELHERFADWLATKATIRSATLVASESTTPSRASSKEPRRAELACRRLRTTLR